MTTVDPTGGAGAAPDDTVFRDPDRSVAERVDALLAQMTLDEKVAQLTSVWLTLDPDAGEFAPSALSFGGDNVWTPEDALDRGVGQITRPLGSQPIDPVVGAEMINGIQRRLIEQTRLGIPAICHEECLTGLMAQGATSFPAPLNFASTWDPDLVQRVGDVIRRQMRSVGTHQGLAPVADVARDARWGRVEETLGEDPYLVGLMVSAYVRGLQGGPAREDMRDGVIATLKHFCGYSFSEGGRNFAPAHVGRRELEDTFLLPFEMAIKDAGALSVMNSYQELDGEAPAASRFLLTEVLRDRWGFEGFTVADYGAVSFLHLFHRVAGDSAEAAAMALRAGLDVELPSPADFPGGVPDAIERGLLTVDTVDLAVRRVLALKFRLGLFDDPFVDVDQVALDNPADQALAAEVASRSLILLRNEGVLPLEADALADVAVIGPNADEVMALFGNYSFENHIVSTHFPNARDVVAAPTVREELERRLGAARVTFARGCEVMSDDRSGFAEAVAAAAAAEVALVVVGDKAGHFQIGTVGEGTDTTDLALPGAQHALVEAVIATGTPTVVVLLNGRPFALGAIATSAAAIVEAWFPGQAGAAAIADVLLGEANPGGKTTVSFTRTAGAQPMFYNHKFQAPGFPRQREYEFVYPFGHGLSYTTFAYDQLTIGPSAVANDGEVQIACTVTNTGARAGDEIVQLYLHDPYASITRPVQQLAGFARVPLAAGTSARVTFTVPVDLISFTGLDLVRIVEPGAVKVKIGSSSADIRLEGSFEVVGPSRVVGEDRRLTSAVHVD